METTIRSIVKNDKAHSGFEPLLFLPQICLHLENVDKHTPVEQHVCLVSILVIDLSLLIIAEVAQTCELEEDASTLLEHISRHTFSKQAASWLKAASGMFKKCWNQMSKTLGTEPCSGV